MKLDDAAPRGGDERAVGGALEQLAQREERAFVIALFLADAGEPPGDLGALGVVRRRELEGPPKGRRGVIEPVGRLSLVGEGECRFHRVLGIARGGTLVGDGRDVRLARGDSSAARPSSGREATAVSRRGRASSMRPATSQARPRREPRDVGVIFVAGARRGCRDLGVDPRGGFSSPRSSAIAARASASAGAKTKAAPPLGDKRAACAAASGNVRDSETRISSTRRLASVAVSGTRAALR